MKDDIIQMIKILADKAKKDEKSCEDLTEILSLVSNEISKVALYQLAHQYNIEDNE
jgi:hypothetical protein